MSTAASTATRSSGASLSGSGPFFRSCSSRVLVSCSYVADVYTELILRFARSINPAATGLFKAKLSPWAKGGPGKKAAPKEDAKPEEPEEIDVAPKKLEWIMTPELKMAVVRPRLLLRVDDVAWL